MFNNFNYLHDIGMKEILLIMILAAATINMVVAEREHAEPGKYPAKYNCSPLGMRYMIADQLEDETINEICKGGKW